MGLSRRPTREQLLRIQPLDRRDRVPHRVPAGPGGRQEAHARGVPGDVSARRGGHRPGVRRRHGTGRGDAGRRPRGRLPGRSLRGDRGRRARRHGDGAPGARFGARPTRRDEAARRRQGQHDAAGSRSAVPLPPRGPHHGAPPAPEHRARSRPRRGRAAAALLHDAADRRREPRGLDPGQRRRRPALPRARRRHPRTRERRDGARPFQARDPSGSQAGERDARPRRRGLRRRLGRRAGA